MQFKIQPKNNKDTLNTLQEINISHLGKRKIIFKYALSGGYVNFLEGIFKNNKLTRSHWCVLGRGLRSLLAPLFRGIWRSVEKISLVCSEAVPPENDGVKWWEPPRSYPFPKRRVQYTFCDYKGNLHFRTMGEVAPEGLLFLFDLRVAPNHLVSPSLSFEEDAVSWGCKSWSWVAFLPS